MLHIERELLAKFKDVLPVFAIEAVKVVLARVGGDLTVIWADGDAVRPSLDPMWAHAKLWKEDIKRKPLGIEPELRELTQRLFTNLLQGRSTGQRIYINGYGLVVEGNESTVLLRMWVEEGQVE